MHPHRFGVTLGTLSVIGKTALLELETISDYKTGCSFGELQMRPQTLARLVSAFSCCLVLGTIIRHDVLNKASLGKDAYLAQQSKYFDNVLAQGTRSPLASLLVQMVVFSTIFVVYELIALAIAKFLTPAAPPQEDQQLGQSF
jgi:hypothetical protein